MAEPVIEVVKKYRGEFEETFDGLRKRATQIQTDLTGEIGKYQEKLQQLQPAIQQQRDDLLNVVKDVESPVEDKEATSKLMETLMWTSLVQFSYFFASIFIGGLFASVIGLVCDTFGTFVLAYVVLPTYALYYAKTNPDGDNDVTIRFKILAFAVIEGILNGFLLSDRHLGVWQPLPFVPTAVIAALAPFAAEKFGKARTTFLGVTVGAAFGTLFVLGLLTGNLSMSYLTISLFYAIISFTTIQFFLKYYAGDKEHAAYYAQLGLFVAALWASGIVYFLFGVNSKHIQAEISKKQAEAAAAAANAPPAPAK